MDVPSASEGILAIFYESRRNFTERWSNYVSPAAVKSPRPLVGSSLGRDLTDRRDESLGSAYQDALGSLESSQQPKQRSALEPPTEGEGEASEGSGPIGHQFDAEAAGAPAASRCKVRVESFSLHGRDRAEDPKYTEPSVDGGASFLDNDGADCDSADAESSSRPRPPRDDAAPSGTQSRPRPKGLDNPGTGTGEGSSAADPANPVSPLRRATRATRAVRRGSNTDPLLLDWRKSNLRLVCHMRHPNIVHLFGISVIETVPYCVVRAPSSVRRPV